jgi:uncharacterized membrane protein
VSPLERAVERGLAAGLLMSALLMLGGLLRGSESALAWGVVLLMLTPVVRVFVVTIGMLLERDWTMGAVSAFVFIVLASGIAAAGFSSWPHALPFR